MALFRTGGLIFKSAKAIFNNPVFILPSSVDLPKRHAARKGYREKVKKQRRMEKMQVTVSKEEQKLKKKFTKITKTFDLKKPEPPSDDVIVLENFNYIKYSLPEIIEFHREYHHPTVFNSPSAVVSLKIEIHMIAKKQTQFLKPFSGIAPIPHPINISGRKEVLVFCKPDDVELAFKYGASMAGGVDLVKKIKEGTIQPNIYDYVIAHNSVLQELTPIRNILKLQMPRAKPGTLTNDLKFTIDKFLHGIEYSCVKVGDSQDFGIIAVDIGTLEMETEKLEANFKAVLSSIEQHRPAREGKFISWIWCLSRPSPMQFSVDLSQYIDVERIKEKAEVPKFAKEKAKQTKAEEEEDEEEEEEMREKQ